MTITQIAVVVVVLAIVAAFLADIPGRRAARRLRDDINRSLEQITASYGREPSPENGIDYAALTQAAMADLHRAPDPDDPQVYRLPGAPPTGRTVKQHGVEDDSEYAARRWTRQADGLWSDSGRTFNFERFAWGYILDAYGPLELVPLTDEETASEALYGPVSARWGNPDQPCPYIDTRPAVAVSCVLGVGHVGPHRDLLGGALGETTLDPDQPSAATGISPHDASAEPCTCHRPDRHRPGCPRYIRTTGGNP
jgi:hypothetical protein